MPGINDCLKLFDITLIDVRSLNLLNQLRIRYKMRDYATHFFLFRNKFNKFNNRSRNDRFYLSCDTKIL